MAKYKQFTHIRFLGSQDSWLSSALKDVLDEDLAIGKVYKIHKLDYDSQKVYFYDNKNKLRYRSFKNVSYEWLSARDTVQIRMKEWLGLE